MPVQTRSMTSSTNSRTKNVQKNVTKTSKNNIKPIKVTFITIKENECEDENELQQLQPNVFNQEVCNPTADVLTTEELTHRNLTPDSRDPSGKWRIVINATEVEFLIAANNYNKLRGKWAVAPDGYYWQYFSEKCYFNFDWYELRPIPK